jgi:outer membrane protein assembly factor BamB
MFKLLKLSGLGVALVFLTLATGNIGQVSIAQSCTVVLRPGDSIQNAINNVSPNSVICLTENTWQESLTITKDNLTLRGQGPSRTFIIGSVLVQVAGRFTVENLTLNAQVQFGLVHTPWPMFRHDPQHTGRSPYVGPASPTLKWRFRDSSSSGFSSPVIEADGTIYICLGDYLYAINPDGTKKWHYEASASDDLTPAIGVDGTIYMSGWRLYAINPNGKVKWDFLPTGVGGYPEMILSSPNIGADGTIYFSSYDSYGYANLYAINPDGTKKWRFRIAISSTLKKGSSPAIGVDGTIYARLDYKLYAINPDGREKWQFSVGSLSISSPAIGVDGTIYVGGYYGYLYAINPDGREKWQIKTIEGDINSSPAIGFDGTIYVGTEDGYLYAINPDGTLKWRFKTGGKIRSSPAIGADGTIYVGSQDGYLYAIAPNGAEKWRFKTGGEIRSSPAIGADGTIYVGSQDGYLYAIGR